MLTSRPALWLDHLTGQWFGDKTGYVLPDEVHTNIPHHGSPGEPTGWNHARGLLIHLPRDFHGTPIALYYRPLEARSGETNGAVVTAIVRDHYEELVTVVWRETPGASRRRRNRTGQLTVNGIPALCITRARRPPASWLAIVAWRIAD